MTTDEKDLTADETNWWITKPIMAPYNAGPDGENAEYKQMYYTLFNGMTDAIKALKRPNVTRRRFS
ncbi:MAG: hypothetical protein LBH95_10050 [Oscillospiraceae bacterium]|nr:hypothetical protein [Oscillospiraceae bacterium]